MSDTDDNHQNLTVRDVYEEIGKNYRYFLNWRHGLFAGYLAVVAALAAGVVRVYSSHPKFVWPLFLAGAIVTLVFWGLEYRNRDVYHACQRSGAECERHFPAGVGIFTRMQNLGGGLLTHSRVLDLFFGVVTIALLVGLAWAICLGV